jgi:hypothetical protein
MFKDLLKGPGGGFLVGVGAVLLAPVVLPVVGLALRPLAKVVLHGYFTLVDELKALAADEVKPAPVLSGLVGAGVEEAATTAGEAAVEEEVGEVVAESVITILEVV